MEYSLIATPEKLFPRKFDYHKSNKSDIVFATIQETTTNFAPMTMLKKNSAADIYWIEEEVLFWPKKSSKPTIEALEWLAQKKSKT